MEEVKLCKNNTNERFSLGCDSVGVLAPLYESFDAASTSEKASNLTQAIIWSLLTLWNVPGNTRYTPVMESSGTDIPGWDNAYNGLVDYALHGDPLPHIPSSFTPGVIDDTTFTKQDENWKTGELSITNPDGFKLMYNVTVPDGVVILDKDGFEIAPNWRTGIHSAQFSDHAQRWYQLC